jgi:hypothetical protein
MPPPTADQAVPSQQASRAAGTPPASLKSPPT